MEQTFKKYTELLELLEEKKNECREINSELSDVKKEIELYMTTNNLNTYNYLGGSFKLSKLTYKSTPTKKTTETNNNPSKPIKVQTLSANEQYLLLSKKK
jgi:hypothetical protein